MLFTNLTANNSRMERQWVSLYYTYLPSCWG